MTWNYYDSASEAEKALLIGRLHPEGPAPTPTQRLELDLTEIRYQDNGKVQGGTGSELISNDEPPVITIAALSP